MLEHIWRKLKVSRRLGLGPVALHYHFRRRTPVSRGFAAAGAREDALPLGGSPQPADHGPSSGHVGRVPPTVRECALIVGVGPGFGHALALSLARAGLDVALVCRRPDRLRPLVAEISTLGRRVAAFGQDATDERGIGALFADVEATLGVPSLVVYSVQEFCPGAGTEVSVPAFESSWRHNCLGAFLVSQAAARAMVPRGSGTILQIGSTSSRVGREGHLNLAVGKFGQRALAQVLARELWPQGIHVAHVLLDADIAESPDVDAGEVCSDPCDISQTLIAVHRQPRSAWSSELDLRPWNERFWEHC